MPTIASSAVTWSSGRVWSPFHPASSTTTRQTATGWSGSPSAKTRRRSPRPWRGWASSHRLITAGRYRARQYPRSHATAPHPGRRRLAVRQRVAPPGAPRRCLPATRYLRPVPPAGGNRVLMVSGSDAHGTPITVKADQEGTTPQEVVDRYHPEILGYWASLGISFDLFTTTMTENHRAGHLGHVPNAARPRIHRPGEKHPVLRPRSRAVPPRPLRRGDLPSLRLRPGSGRPMRQLRSDPRPRPVDRTQEHADRRHPGPTGDRALPASQAGRSPPRLVEEPGWRKHVQNMAIGFVEEGLIDRPITRDLDWGIPPRQRRTRSGRESGSTSGSRR